MTASRPARVFVTLGMAALAGVLGAPLVAPAAQAATTQCLVRNQATGVGYHSLQAAQDAASAGATLLVRGRCTGTTQVSKDLTITGQQSAGFGAPTLDGKFAGTVITIGSGIVVTINTLTITAGTATGPYGYAGGIANDGTLTMNHSKIADNSNGFFNGFAAGSSNSASHNSRFARLTLNDSSVTGNTRSGGGANFGILTLNHSSVTGNTNSGYGGGIYSEGTLRLNDGSSITRNTAHGQFGGGVFSYGALTLHSSSISGNTAAIGGGIENYSGSVTLHGSSVTGNTASSSGGGIQNAGTLTLDGSTVTGNKAGNGGGIWNRNGTLTLDGSSIAGNTAGIDGGGIWNRGSPVTLVGSSVTGNTAGIDGGGIWNRNGTLTLEGSSVTGNLPDDIS